MRRLAKNLILVTATVSAIFFVDLSDAEASNYQFKSCPLLTNTNLQYADFWSKFRDTVMPRPDEPQNNNPPKKPEPPPEDDDTTEHKKTSD